MEAIKSSSKLRRENLGTSTHNRESSRRPIDPSLFAKQKFEHRIPRIVILDFEGRSNLFMNLQNATEERLQHAQTLLHELEIFKRHLEKKKKYQVEYRHFQNDIKKELEALKSFQHIFKSYDGQTESPALEAAQHALKSSNLPFLEAVWEAAKRSSDVVSLKRHGQAIDAVAEGGLLWIKVFNMTERRLLFEMAEEGWEWVSWEEEHEETCIPKTRTNISHDDSKALGSSGPESGESNLTLLKVAESLVRLSKQTRVKHKHPQVLFILPRYVRF